MIQCQCLSWVEWNMQWRGYQKSLVPKTWNEEFNNGEILLDSGNRNGDQQIQNKISIEHLSAILETYSELMDLLDQDPDVQRGLNARQKIESALQSYKEMSSEENSELNNIEA